MAKDPVKALFSVNCVCQRKASLLEYSYRVIEVHKVKFRLPFFFKKTRKMSFFLNQITQKLLNNINSCEAHADDVKKEIFLL